MATHSSVLAWRIPGTGSLVGCRLWGRTESDTTEETQQQQQTRLLCEKRGESISFRVRLVPVSALLLPELGELSWPLRKISLLLLLFFFFLQWLDHNLSHGLMEEVTWHCSAFCNTDSVQVLGEPDILFASLSGCVVVHRQDSYWRWERSRSWREESCKILGKISNDRNEKLKSCEVNPKRLCSLGSSSFIRPWRVLGGGRSFSGNESPWVVSTLSCTVKVRLMMLSIIWNVKRSEIWL